MLRLLLSLLGGLPLLVVSAVLLLSWVMPSADENPAWLRAASVLVILEFILLHSGAFMALGPILLAARWQRFLWFLGFCLFYSGAIYAFASWSGDGYIFWFVSAVVVTRLLSLVLLDDKRSVIIMLQRSAIGMVLLVLTCVLLFLPLPQFGITGDLRTEVFGPVQDMLTGHPERTMAWGAAYFFLMALVEFYAGWHLPDWKNEEVNKAWQALKK